MIGYNSMRWGKKSTAKRCWQRERRTGGWVIEARGTVIEAGGAAEDIVIETEGAVAGTMPSKRSFNGSNVEVLKFLYGHSGR